MAFLFVGIERLNLEPDSPNDCLTIALATMRDEGFADLKRGNDVSGSRAGASCRRRAAPRRDKLILGVRRLGRRRRERDTGRELTR